MIDADRDRFIRPSSLGPIDACPGRPTMEARMCAAVPGWEDVGSAVAMEGTIGHEIVAQTLTLTYHQPDGWQVPADAEQQVAARMSRLKPWARDAARRCTAYAVALVDRAVETGLAVTIQIEMHLSGKGIDIGRGGTADVVILCHDDTGRCRRVILDDHKLGFLDQGRASGNIQLSAYAVMAYDRHRPTDGVEVHLAQGRRQEWSSAIYQGHDIEPARRRIRRIVAAARASCPPLRPSIGACRYCKALPLCAAARRYIMDAAEEASLFGIEPADRVRMDDAAKVARRFAEQVKQLQKHWLESRSDDDGGKTWAT